MQPTIQAQKNAPSRLNERDLLIYSHLSNFMNDYGYAPTIRELMVLADIPSTDSVHHSLARLARAGYITRRGNAARAIQITGQAPALDIRQPKHADNIGATLLKLQSDVAALLWKIRNNVDDSVDYALLRRRLDAVARACAEVDGYVA